MMQSERRRVLVVDDEPQLISAYRSCFDMAGQEADDDLAALEAALFGGGDGNVRDDARERFDVDYATQGEQAVELASAAVAEGRPYAVIFLDMRMPPGIDGKETAKRVRAVDARTNIIIVTGYSDHAPHQVAKVAGPPDKLYYLAKPFEMEEVRHLASALGEKWQLEEALRDANVKLAQQLEMLEAAHIELKASEARVRHIALHDTLTKLPNRLAFMNHLGESLRDGAGPVSVLYLDLDRFKGINDTLGHEAGDELVRVLGNRIRDALPYGGTVARLSGDEFGIALRGGSFEDAVAFGQELVRIVAEPREVLSVSVSMGMSVGVAWTDQQFLDPSELLRQADLALYAAKAEGGSCVIAFTPELDKGARKRVEIERRLRVALREDTLSLVYQPIVDQGSGATVGYEALLRWDDPELGVVPPAMFVPVAEETGLIIELGNWVIRRALAEATTWSQGYVSINVSPRQFLNPDLPRYMVQQAEAAGISPRRVQLEITETALFHDNERSRNMLIQLRANGFLVALDDFGTGYSSLVHLKDFCVDSLKIDRSFVAHLGNDAQASAIILAITGLARSIGMSVIGEGVENQTQVQALRIAGCGQMQGYFFSRPLLTSQLPYVCAELGAKAVDAPGVAAAPRLAG